jgi:hypothetical protein
VYISLSTQSGNFWIHHRINISGLTGWKRMCIEIFTKTAKKQTNKQTKKVVVKGKVVTVLN